MGGVGVETLGRALQRRTTTQDCGSDEVGSARSRWGQSGDMSPPLFAVLCRTKLLSVPVLPLEVLLNRVDLLACNGSDGTIGDDLGAHPFSDVMPVLPGLYNI